MRRRILKALVILFSMLLTGAASYQEWFYYVGQNLTDTLYQQPGIPNPDIKIIAVDEKSLASLGTFGTWNREVYAQLVDRLAQEAEPAIIGFDVIFAEDMEEEGDTAFAEACDRAGNVVVASELLNKSKAVKNLDTGETYVDTLYVEQVVEPYDRLKESVSSGFADSTLDRDGYVRQAFWTIPYEKEELKSFSRVVYERYMESQGRTTMIPDTDKYGRFGFAYTGKPGDYDRYSLIDVLEGNIDLRLLKDSIVLVGAYADGLQDNFYVADSRSGDQMYGVEVQANIIQSYMDGKTKVSVDPVLTACVLALLIGIYAHMLDRTKLRGSLTAFTVICVISIGGGVLLYRMGYYMQIIAAPLMALVMGIINITISYLVESVKRKRLINMFKRYVGPKVADHVMKDEDYKVELLGENRDVAVLFVDIRSFTSLSETLSPQEIVEMLNLYLDMATQSIFKQRGMLDKFIGDAAMAVFNAPFDLPDYEYRAVQAAFGIVRNSQKLAAYTQEHFGKRVEFGIGIHCGPAVVGNIGCDIRLDYTAIGDTVNTASRIEGHAKGGQVLISSEMRERLGDRIRVREAGLTSLKGKQEQMMLYEVTELVLAGGIGVISMEKEIKEMKESIGCDAASLWLLEDGVLYPYIFSGPKGNKLEGMKLELNQGACGYCVSNKEALMINDTSKDKRWYETADEVTGYTTKNLICLPIIINDECVGCIELLNKPEDFVEEDMEKCKDLLQLLVEQL